MPVEQQPAPRRQRVVSIDVLRGLTIFLMIFVNDIAGVPGTPAWLKHFEPSTGNGMTIVDVVFPAFLFIVGLAIPLAFRARERRGESTGTTIRHVVTRTVSLLIIGVLMVNSDSASRGGLVNPNLWTLLMYVGVFLGSQTTSIRSEYTKSRGSSVWR
jgi:predicted acyltransferase